MISEQTIPCPTCKTPILFNAVELVKGHKFSCSSCFSVVGIAEEAIDMASQTINTYEELKRQATRAKSNSKK